MTYPGWEPRYRVTTTRPGKLDLFVMTLVNGRSVKTEPITEYETAVSRAHDFLKEHDCQVKVLPMTGAEMRNVLSAAPSDAVRAIDAADRSAFLANVLDLLRQCNDEDDRRDLIQILTDMGAVQ